MHIPNNRTGERLSINAPRVTKTNITPILKKNMRQIVHLCSIGTMDVYVTDNETGEVIANGTLTTNVFSGRNDLTMNF